MNSDLGLSAICLIWIKKQIEPMAHSDQEALEMYSVLMCYRDNFRNKAE